MIEPVQTTKKRRRRWSESEKLDILKSAEGSNFSEAARANGISTGQIFQWRKQLQSPKEAEVDQLEPEQELLAALKRNDKKLESVDQLCTKLLTDVNAGKLTAYNGVNAYSSATRAFTSLQSQRFEIMDRLASIAANTDRRADDSVPDTIDFAMEKEAERICYTLVKSEVERKRAAEAAAISAGLPK
jgi:transposase-like protein